MDEQQATASFTDTSSATRVGRFSYRPATETWTWSDGMFQIHGFEPGEVVPTTDLVISHIHPDDQSSAFTSRDAAVALARPFTFPHRIFTATREQRIVIAVGHVEEDEQGQVVVGHLVDVTEFRRDAVTAELDQAVQDFHAHRARIEQAKGVLMQLYSVDGDTAWQMLRAYSQDRNRKVRELSQALVEAASADLTPSKEQRGVVHDVLDRIARSDPHPGEPAGA